MHTRSHALAVWLALLPASGATAQAPQPSRTATAPHTSIEVLAASATLDAATDTWIAVRFLLEPGWHIYWRNPGDSGAPPLLLWTLPPGVTVGDVEWPAPERIPYGTLVNYGYHGDVILPMRLRSTAPVAGPLALNASWSVCRDVCVQARARVALPFPVPPSATASVAGWAAQIAEARQRVPGPLPKTWRATARPTATGFDITITAPVRIAPVSFFSIDEGVIEEAAAPIVTAAPRGARLSLTRAAGLTKPPAALRGVLTLADDAAYAVDLPLAAPTAAKGSRR